MMQANTAAIGIHTRGNVVRGYFAMTPSIVLLPGDQEVLSALLTYYSIFTFRSSICKELA